MLFDCVRYGNTYFESERSEPVDDGREKEREQDRDVGTDQLLARKEKSLRNKKL